jgi:hypothetical protein
MMRGIVLLAAMAFSIGATVVGCYRDRERLDVPVLTLVPDVDSVSPGDTLRGVMHATDGSGLILVRLLATYRSDTLTPAVDTIRLRYDLPELTEVELLFSIPIPGASPVGSRVALVAAAFDDQDFLVEATDTLWVVP